MRSITPRAEKRGMRVVFILSTNYAGSHLLAQLLGAHPKACSIGELHNYRKQLERPDERRSVIDDFAVNAQFAGLGELPIDQWHADIAARARQRTPALDTLIDNSKRVAWARRFIDNPRFPATFVHLLRDPRALVRRWQLAYDTTRKRRRQRLRVIKARPLWLLPALLNEQWDVYCCKWLIGNQRISNFLARQGQQKNMLTYRDLAVDTEGSLQYLMPLLGADYDPHQLRYGEVEHGGTLKREYLERSRHSKIDLDLRWRHELAPGQLRQITAHRGIRRYLGRLGVRMLDDGLTLPR